MNILSLEVNHFGLHCIKESQTQYKIEKQIHSS